MTNVSRTVMAAVVGSWLAIGQTAHAADSAVGTWVRTDAAAKQLPPITMSIEMWGKSRIKVTYQIQSAEKMLMTIDSKADGSDAPVIVNDQSSGQTMGIKLIDAHHATTVLKWNGKKIGTSKGTLSPDGNTLTVDNDITADSPGGSKGKTTEVWVRK